MVVLGKPNQRLDTGCDPVHGRIMGLTADRPQTVPRLGQTGRGILRFRFSYNSVPPLLTPRPYYENMTPKTTGQCGRPSA
jgi:hypothetical protein